MIKMLGILDAIASISLILAAFNILLPRNLYFAFAAYLVIKGIIFIRSFVSVFDLAAGIALLAIPFLSIPQTVLIIIAILLLQKGIFSMLSHY